MTDAERIALCKALGWEYLVRAVHVGGGQLWPLSWFGTGDGMLAIIDRMVELGWTYSIDGAAPHSVAFANDETSASADDSTLPSAVEQAAYRALVGRKENSGG